MSLLILQTFFELGGQKNEDKLLVVSGLYAVRLATLTFISTQQRSHIRLEFEVIDNLVRGDAKFAIAAENYRDIACLREMAKNNSKNNKKRNAEEHARNAPDVTPEPQIQENHDRA